MSQSCVPSYSSKAYFAYIVLQLQDLFMLMLSIYANVSIHALFWNLNMILCVGV